jgi:acetolactate decarboxylase
MRRRRFHLVVLVSLSLALIGCQSMPTQAAKRVPQSESDVFQPVDRDVAYQTSTITALLAGEYDGDLTCGALLEHGDFGLGTFDGLDGEMIVLDGVAYRAKLNGDIEVVEADEETPFAVVTFLDADRGVKGIGQMQDAMDMDALKADLDELLGDPEKPHAIRIDGKFESLLTRSVPKQSEPYPPLTEAIKGQQERQHTNITGTIVGFYFPEWASGANVAGYHFHFISGDRAVGGHVLALAMTSMAIETDVCDNVVIELLDESTTTPTLSPDARHEVLREIESR